MDHSEDKQAAARLGYIDIAKGIAILAVIVGHFYAPPNLAGRVIYSFHMPLFFIVSGYFVKDYRIKKNLIRSCKGLLIPYVCGMGIIMVIDCVTADGSQKLASAIQVLVDMVGGMCKESAVFPVFRDVDMLWFLPSLFACRMLYVFAMNVTEKSKYSSSIRIIVITVLAFVGLASPILTYEYFPWGIEISLVSLLFLFCGNMLHKYQVFSDKHRFLIAGACLILWIILLCFGFYIELAAHYWPGFFLSVIEGMIASFVVICGSQLLDRVKVLNTILRWIGKNSLIVLLVHAVDNHCGVSDRLLDMINITEPVLSLLIRIAFILLITGVVGIICYLITYFRTVNTFTT